MSKISPAQRLEAAKNSLEKTIGELREIAEEVELVLLDVDQLFDYAEDIENTIKSLKNMV